MSATVFIRIAQLQVYLHQRGAVSVRRTLLRGIGDYLEQGIRIVMVAVNGNSGGRRKRIRGMGRR